MLSLYKTRQEASATADVSTDMLTAYVTDKAKPRFDAVAKLALRQGVSLDWLATGEGPMKRQETASFGELGDDYILLPRYDARGSTGAGALVETAEIVDHLAFRKDWIRTRLRRDPKNLLLIEASGDSMLPKIADGDVLLIDTSESRVRADAIYAFELSGELYVKRIQRMPDRLVIKSINPEYEPWEIAGEQAAALRVVGQVVWHGGLT